MTNQNTSTGNVSPVSQVDPDEVAFEEVKSFVRDALTRLESAHRRLTSVSQRPNSRPENAQKAHRCIEAVQTAEGAVRAANVALSR